MAETPLVRLIGLYFAVVVAASLLLTLVMALVWPFASGGGFGHVWRLELTALLGMPRGVLSEDVPGFWWNASMIMTGVTAVLLPTLLLGALVFKFFVAPPVFVTRKTVAIMENPSGHHTLSHEGRHLAIRCYSGTRIRLLDVSFEVVLRTWCEDGNSGVYILSRALPVVNPNFPVVEPFLPHTVQVELAPGDVELDDEAGTMRLTSIGERPLGAVASRSDMLVLIVRAKLPDLGTDLIESHEFRAPDGCAFRAYAPVDADLDVPAPGWDGWAAFDA